MPFGQFVFWSLLGTTAWTSILAVAGSALGQGYGAVERFVGPISLGIIVLLVVAYVWRVATWRR